MKIAAIILLASLTAAGRAQTAKAHGGHTDAEVIEGLRFEAHRHHMYFFIFCVPGSPISYQAEAKFIGAARSNIYIEEGAKDWDFGDGPTAIDAAYELYLRLANNLPLREHPDHRPDYRISADPNCNYNTVYDSEHAGKIPCKPTH